MKSNLKKCMIVIPCLIIFNTNAALLDAEKISPNGLTDKQAEEVLKIELKQQKYNFTPKGVYLEKISRPSFNGYIEFGLYGNSQNDGNTLGGYMVSLKTGDVWDSDLCVRQKSLELEKVQKKIMEKTKTTMPTEKQAEDLISCEPGPYSH